MSRAEADFTVFGTTPLARLLAGLLAASHGRRVLHVGESQAGYRLARGVDLSVAPITRPESWSMLRNGVAETLKLIGKVAGRGAVTHIDPVFFASGNPAREALLHCRQMALAFGLAAEPTTPSLLGPARYGVTLRDAVRLNRPVLEAALDAWLEKQGVRLVAPQAASIAPDGGTTLIVDGIEQFGGQAVLADDEAIFRYLPLRQWSPLLVRQKRSSLLTVPGRPLAAPLMLDFDSGLLLKRQAEGGIAAVGAGDLAQLTLDLQTQLGRDRPLELAGQTAFPALITADGAPAVGRALGVGADVVAGFGMAGAFFAPALARWLCATATPEEKAWFEARLVNRSAAGPAVADYLPPDWGRAA